MYEAKITGTSMNLTAKERVMYKDVQNCVKLDQATQEAPVMIEVKGYVELEINNDKATPQQYANYIIVDKSGARYVTGSSSFWSAFQNIWEEMANVDEPWLLKVYRLPSKNRQGKEFITCAFE